MSLVQEQSSHSVSVVQVKGPLRAPVRSDLRREVRARLRRGERRVVVSLAGVPNLDAAGVGQLVRAYNMTIAAHGVLRIADATRKVRVVLQRVGLLDRLSADSPSDIRPRTRGLLLENAPYCRGADERSAQAVDLVE